jgi:hypothetical protein
MKLIITESQLKHIAKVAASVVPLNEIVAKQPLDEQSATGAANNGVATGTVNNAQSVDQQIANEINNGAEGAGTNEKMILNAIKKIKDTAQFWRVDAILKTKGNKYNFAQIMNDEFSWEDSEDVRTIIAALNKLNVAATATFSANNTFTDNTFKITSAPVAAAPAATVRTGWWDKYPGLVAFGKDTTKTKVIHYPVEASKDTGYIYYELTSNPGTYWSFSPDLKWKQFEGFENFAKPKYTGTWRDNAGVLTIAASDGTNYTPTTGWSEKKKSNINWVKQSGNFPLKYGEFGGMIEMLQLSLGLRGDTYFGPATEKAVQKKDGSYKRETGVTEAMYYNIVGKNDVSKAATASPSQLAAPTDPGAAQTQAPAAQPAAAQPQGQVPQGSNTASTNNPY